MSTSVKTLRASSPAPYHTAIPAGFLGDAVQLVPHSKSRNRLRAGIWIFAVTAVVGLTITTYVTDQSIRDSVSVNRKYDNFTPDDAQNGICPCERIWLPWGEFMVPNAAMGTKAHPNSTAINAFLQDQCTTAIGGYRSGGLKVSPGFVQNAASGLCKSTMLTVVPAIMNITASSTLMSPNMLGPKSVQKGYVIYVGQTVVEQVRGGLLAYSSLQTAAATVAGRATCQSQNRTDGECKEFLAQNQVLAVSTASATLMSGIEANQGALGEVSEKILSAFGNPTDPGSITGLFETIQGIVGKLAQADWEAYKNVCKPRYCDVFGKKSAVTRLTEFLTTVGGVWQSIMIISITLWMLGSCCLGLEGYSYLAEPDPIANPGSPHSFKMSPSMPPPNVI